MNFKFVLMLIVFAVIKEEVIAQIGPQIGPLDRQVMFPHTDSGQNNGGPNIDLIGDLKDTNRTERDLLICNPSSSAPLVKVEINSDSQAYSRLCDISRNLTQFRISINVTTKNKKWPIVSVLKVLHFQEKRINGSVKVNAIGFVETGVESLIGLAFYVVYDVPNLNLAACYSLEGLTRQTGVGHIIFADLDLRRLEGLQEKYNSDQLVSLFLKHSVVDCVGGTVLSYLPGLLNEKVLEELYPISSTERRETIESIEQTLDECEILTANIIKMDEKSQYKTWDSCDATDLFDRYEDDTSFFKVYFGSNQTAVPTEVRIHYSNGFRDKGSFYGIGLGIVVNGPKALIGAAYLEVLDIPNFDPYSCQREPGIKQLLGSSEKIIANLDVQNLLSVMDLDSIITKIRSNRVADCLGSVSVHFSPGLVFSETLLNQYNVEKETESPAKIKFWQNWKNQLKQNRYRKNQLSTKNTDLRFHLKDSKIINKDI